jgi:predicted hotdog family 3-hydroxylacyl-ACP dehydratase
MSQCLDVREFLPHTGNMVLIDHILDVGDNYLTALAQVRSDGLLLGNECFVPAWAGLEYMAQTIAAYVGYHAKQNNQPVQLGFLLGTRQYTSNVDKFSVGAKLVIRIEKIMQDELLGVFDCTIKSEHVDVKAKITAYQPDSIENLKPL